MVARYGGEELCLVLPGADLYGAGALLADMRRDGPVVDEHGNGVTFSAGIAEWRAGDDGPALIERADRALFEAKRAGRNRVHVTV
ncbi:MAG: GGDEF domain-containing protein [Acidimicrobiales bacterium]